MEIYPRGEAEVSPKKERTRELQLHTEQNANLCLKVQELNVLHLDPEVTVTK
jgi:hypothetical protein